ncbi:MAG: STAS-like domain-containing protein [Methanothrix sp.]
MNDVQVVYSGTSGTIGINAKVLGLAAQFYGFPGHEMEDVASKQSIDWIGPSCLPAAPSEGVVVGQSGVVYHSGLGSDERWSYSKSPENRNGGTTHAYREAIASMEVEKVVCIRDIVESELCISSNNGQKVFGAIESAISQGNKVRLSFENINSLSPAFVESAIGQLYNGNIQGNIDEKLSFADISLGRKLIVDEVIREAKEYYSNPEAYIAKMKELFADD